MRINIKNLSYRAPAIVLTVITLAVAVAVTRAWFAQTGAGASCSSSIPGEADYFEGGEGYVQVELTEQAAHEPIFNGSLMYELNYAVKEESLYIETTGNQGYGDSIHYPEVTSGEDEANIKVDDWGLNPLRGSHRLFPFDSAKFDVGITPTPSLRVGTVMVVNRVSGFVLDCSTVSGRKGDKGMTRVKFSLQRNPLIQITAIVLFGGSFAFAVLIFRSKTVESLAGSAASSFFSMWSVRSILSSQIRTFPTVLDLGILTMCMLILIVVFWKTFVGRKEPPNGKGRVAVFW